MDRTCRFSLESRSGAAGWSFDGTYLTVSPAEGTPLCFRLAECAGVAGDGYTVRLAVPGVGIEPGEPGATEAELILSRLGAEGPTLLETLRREWLVARADILRLGGSGEAKPFSGQVSGPDAASPGAATPFHGLLFEDVLVLAREGRDLEPYFLALLGEVTSDEAAYAVRVRRWPGQEVVFSKLGGRTEEFLRSLKMNRAALAEESAATLAAAVPTLPAGPRAVLSGMWMPGRLMELDAMDAVCPGFAAAFRQTWLPGLLRREEGAWLLDWAASGSSWLGCMRARTGEAASFGVDADGGSPLWLLCGRNGVWLLEALSIEDRATYCFAGGEELPRLVSQLLCAPQFSREALYSPLAQLAQNDSDLVVAAQHLGFLVELRERFRGRAIHQGFEEWRRDVEVLGAGGQP